jgi:hypothetical protein
MNGLSSVGSVDLVGKIWDQKGGLWFLPHGTDCTLLIESGYGSGALLLIRVVFYSIQEYTDE